MNWTFFLQQQLTQLDKGNSFICYEESQLKQFAVNLKPCILEKIPWNHKKHKINIHMIGNVTMTTKTMVSKSFLD